MQGWIKLHRQLLDWEWYDDHNTTRLFIHLLLKASHVSKKWRGQTIKPGQLRTTIGELAIETGLSIKNTRTSLNHLKSTNEVASQTTNKGTVISINNWGEYQQDGKWPGKQVANKGQTGGKLTSGLKNVKNVKNVKKREIATPLKDRLNESDFEVIAERYKVPTSFVISKWDDLINYCISKGKTYKNYKAALSSWVKKDAIKRIDDVKQNNSKTAIDLSGV